VNVELEPLYHVLQKLTGLHRQLLDTVRMEREALVAADKKSIQETTYAKEAIIEAIRQQESLRMKCMGELFAIWKKPPSEMTLKQVMIHVQGYDPKSAEVLRGTYNALTVMIQHITEQNLSNRELIEVSLEHVQNMKKNVLSEAVPNSNTYTAHGQKTGGASGARLISREA